MNVAALCCLPYNSVAILILKDSLKIIVLKQYAGHREREPEEKSKSVTSLLLGLSLPLLLLYVRMSHGQFHNNVKRFSGLRWNLFSSRRSELSRKNTRLSRRLKSARHPRHIGRTQKRLTDCRIQLGKDASHCKECVLSDWALRGEGVSNEVPGLALAGDLCFTSIFISPFSCFPSSLHCLLSNNRLN